MADEPDPSVHAVPAGAQLIRTTAEFDELNLPAGLLRAHHLAADVWGLLRVRSGSMRFVFEGRHDGGQVIESGNSQLIPPQVLHHIELVGPVRFVIEFHRAPPS